MESIWILSRIEVMFQKKLFFRAGLGGTMPGRGVDKIE